MGRTTNIVISTNPKTKTRQTQTIWFGDGEIRLNGETGTYIGEYAKDGGYYAAVLIFKDNTSLLRLSVQSISPPLTTATQAAQAVAWAWHACKALEGFAAAAAPVFNELWEERAVESIEAAFQKVREDNDREAQAEATWQEYCAKGGWWYIVTAKKNYLVFNAAEERAFYTTQKGELFREVDAREEVDYALTCWDDSTIHPYTGEVWAYYFRATFADSDAGNTQGDTDALLFCKHVAFDELETPEQVSAYLFISESEELDDIPEWAMHVEFHWKLTYLKAQDYFGHYEDGISVAHKARRDEHRTIIAVCK
jgi:hypothetical protein